MTGGAMSADDVMALFVGLGVDPEKPLLITHDGEQLEVYGVFENADGVWLAARPSRTLRQLDLKIPVRSQ